MTTYALAPADVPTGDHIVDNCRLVAIFPLSGQADCGPRIYIDEHPDGTVRFWIVDETHTRFVVPRHFDHLHEAVKRALANCGWGDYTITPPEGINW